MSEKIGKNQDERFSHLEEENKSLRKQLEKMKELEEDLRSHRIYLDARKKLMGFVTIIFVILTVFGIVSLESIKDSIKRTLEKRGIDSIVKEIKQDFLDTYQSKIMTEIIAIYNSQVDSKIDHAIRTDVLEPAKETQKSTNSSSKEGFATAIQKRFEGRKYYVIAMTSPKRSDIKKEINRVKSLVGEESFEKQFPNYDIYPRNSEDKVFTLLVSGKALPYEEANRLKREAIEAGFQKDTWIWQSTVDYFAEK